MLQAACPEWPDLLNKDLVYIRPPDPSPPPLFFLSRFPAGCRTRVSPLLPLSNGNNPSILNENGL
jgi:hypothetical protein